MLSRAVFSLLFSAALSVQSPQTAPGLQTLEVVPLPRDGEVLVSFKLNETLTDEVRTAIQSGLTIKFLYKVDLRRSSTLWVDRTLASASVGATLRYDTLTREYHVARSIDGRTEKADVTGREDVAWSWLTADFTRLSLFRGVPLEANAEYYLKVRANTSPRNASFIWPWTGDDAVGLAKFTFMK
ncbi:MAG TPA: DUF4390 domain-containing protein [Vicinamibacterales bacterium]